MGKLITYLIALIFIDLLFIITGQVCGVDACSLGSIIFNALLNLGALNFTQFFTELIGDFLNLATSTTGILSLLATGGVIIGAFLATREITILFIPLALTLAVIAGDFIFIYTELFKFSPILATLIMSPIIIIYAFVIVEWLRGKD